MKTPRHAATVRITHWITVVAFLALLVTGLEIIVSHPRFYWGETGNVMMKPLFSFPIPSSRNTVPTGYGYTMPDQNGWSRALHFEAAWVAVLTGLVYVLWGLWRGHFRREMWPKKGERSLAAYWTVIGQSFRPGQMKGGVGSYNVVQRAAYLLVVFVLFPMIIWTGLAMSPSFTAAFPMTAILLGGRQSARTLHFAITVLLVLFLVVHIAMIWIAGFWNRLKPMILGKAAEPEEGA